MKKNRIKYGIYFYTKNVFQILLWLFEIVVIPGFFVLFSFQVVPVNASTTFFDYLERYIAFYALYQILIYISLKSINDCKKDQILAITSVYESVQLYIETKDPQIKDVIKQVCARQLDQATMNSNAFMQEYKYIFASVDSDNIVNDLSKIRFRLINLRHELETLSLNWNFSFIVRLFK